MGGEHRLHVVPGGGANEVADFIADNMGDGARVGFRRGLAGENDDACLDVVRRQFRAGKGRVDDAS